jgi:hypothetical protein
VLLRLGLTVVRNPSPVPEPVLLASYWAWVIATQLLDDPVLRARSLSPGSGGLGEVLAAR